jgi:uncharacterized membrane protein YqjE
MAEVLNGHPARTTVELVQQASEQIGRLVRAEIALARAELTEKGRQAAAGAVLLAVAGILAFFAAATLVATAVLALALVLPGWAAAAVVAGVLLLVAAVLALVARGRLAKAGAGGALDSVRAEVDEFRHALAGHARDGAGTAAGEGVGDTVRDGGVASDGPVGAVARRRADKPAGTVPRQSAETQSVETQSVETAALASARQNVEMTDMAAQRRQMNATSAAAGQRHTEVTGPDSGATAAWPGLTGVDRGVE